MNKREIILYVITILSLIAFVYIVFGAVSKTPSNSNQKFAGLTGNTVVNFEDNFKAGDRLTGDITINEDETSAYGVLLLTKNNKALITKTFSLKEALIKDANSGENIIKIEDLIDYKLEEKGNYELFFSILDLNINIKKEFVVK
ncbi:MAG: hypothetical protein KKB21_01755 [Nanoarchaeota archaeon]|nr:hypothetical protein [Nanoarchaeota archaeon]MBU4086282.1 hypothetical protein [Nanoarchaeota archaeon]